MRALLALILITLAAFSGAVPAAAQSSEGGVQSLFLGQRLCGDTRDICFVSVTQTLHRYLHIVVHSVPDDTDWQVQAGPTCSGPMWNIAGGAPVPQSGYLETVVDLAETYPPLAQLLVCLALRGREHYYVHYYAAYLDDSAGQDAEQLYPGYQDLAGRPDLPDLDVLYIHRSPAYAYDATPNQPRPGDTVAFTAHIFNAGGLTAAATSYEWLLDGRRLASGTLPSTLAPGAETEVTQPWKWNAGPHTLKFRLLPASAEISVVNDSLSVRTDALSLGFWVEQGAWNYFLDRQWEYCVPLSCAGSDSFPDWLERQVAVWNHILATSSYSYPNRVTVADRVRVDQITVVPDGALPLHGGLATNTPDSADHTVDLEWGLPAAGVEHTYPDAFEGRFDVDLSLLHELGHARSLADLYRFDLQLDGNSTVDVLDEHGKPAFDPGNPFDLSRPLHAFYSDAAAPYLYADSEDDVMSCACARFYSAYDAILLNRLRGRRAQCGNANPPCNLGDWFADIPAVSRLRLLDNHGRHVADGTPVRLFFDSGQGYGDHRFTQSDSLTLATTGDTIQLPPDPFHAGGNMSRAGHNLLLVEAQTPERDAFCFIEPSALNLADWLGYAGKSHPAVLTLDLRRIQRNACNLSLPAPRVNDPFATSPNDSRAVVGSSRDSPEVSVMLRDDGTPAQPMRGREVQILGAGGHVLAQGATAADGTVRLRATAKPLQVVDVTDNGLVIPLAASGSRRQAARRR